MPLPCLARLPVVATGTKASRSDAETLPVELWTKIVALSADDDACEKLNELCRKQHLAKWMPSCKDGSLHDELNARFGWYGDLSGMAAVLQKHGESLSKAAKIPKDKLNTKTYFDFMCSRQDWLNRFFVDLAKDPDPVLGPNFHKKLLRATIRQDLQGPLDAPWVTALAKYVVGLDPQLLMLVPGSLVPYMVAADLDFQMPTNIRLILEKDGSSLMTLVPTSKNGGIAGYAEVAMAAVTKDGASLRYVPGAQPPIQLDDNPPLREALKAYEGRYPEPVPNFAELATIAVQTTPRCLKYVPPEHPKWTEIAKAAVRADAINLVDVPETHADYDTLLGAADYDEVVRLDSQGAGESAAARAQLRRATMRLWAQQQQPKTGGVA